MVKGPEVVRGLQVGGGPEVGEVPRVGTQLKHDHAAARLVKNFFTRKIPNFQS